MSQDNAGPTPYISGDSYYKGTEKATKPVIELPKSMSETAEYKKALELYGNISCYKILKYLEDAIVEQMTHRKKRVPVHALNNIQTIPTAQLSMFEIYGFDENTLFKELLSHLSKRGKSESTIRYLLKALEIFKYPI